MYVNTGRYSTNPNPGKAPSLTLFKKVLNLNLPVTLTPAPAPAPAVPLPDSWPGTVGRMSHVDLAKAFAPKVKASGIWVYDNGVLLNGSPFSSFASAMKAIAYSKTSIAGRRSIDTGKLIGGRFTFYSKPLPAG